MNLSTFTATLKRNFATLLLTLILCCSLALNVVIADRLRSLGRPHIAGVQAGAVLSHIGAEDVLGHRADLSLNDGRETVLYVMAPSCGWCKKNRPNILALAASASQRFRFIGVSNTKVKLREYLHTAPLPFPVYLVDGKNAPVQFDLSITPQTLIVGVGGVVKKAWIGALDKRIQREVEAYFSVTLPGIS